MRPTVEYKGWACWGKEGVVRHLCPLRSPPGRVSYSLSGLIYCAACGTQIPAETLSYFERMHKLLLKSGM